MRSALVAASALTAALAVAILVGPGSALAFDVYALPEDVPFEIPMNGSVLKGVFHGASPQDIGSWDLSTFGQDAGAPPGTHACADLGFNPFASCPFRVEFAGDSADALAFRLSLDPASAPVSNAGPAFNPFVQTASGGSAYIIPAEASADRVPVSSSSGQFQFQDFGEPTNASFYLQPGESTTWLLSRYQPGALAAGLAGGTTFRMGLTSGTMGGQTAVLALVTMPEPATPDAGGLALGTLAAAAARCTRSRSGCRRSRVQHGGS